MLLVSQRQLCAEPPLHASWTVVFYLRRTTAMPSHHMSASRVQGLLHSLQKIAKLEKPNYQLHNCRWALTGGSMQWQLQGTYGGSS